VHAPGAALLDLAGLPVGPDDLAGLGQDALLPGRGHLGRQIERADTGVVAFQISPEQPAQAERQIPQGGVVEHRLPFGQIGDEDIADRAAGNGITVDQLRRAELTGGAERPKGRGCVRGEHAHLVEQLVEPHRLVRAQRPAVDRQRQLQTVPDGDLA
jgi:hypothetical protein